MSTESSVHPLSMTPIFTNKNYFTYFSSTIFKHVLRSFHVLTGLGIKDSHPTTAALL